MPKAKSIPPDAPTTYALLGMRLQTVINSPRAQKEQAAVLQRLPSDRPEDWDQLVNEISENDSVTITSRDDGNIQISWVALKDD